MAVTHEKIYAGLGLLAVACSAAWLFTQRPKVEALRNTPVLNPVHAVYTPAGIDSKISDTQPWPDAPAQSGGAEWVYDVFTPPVIYYVNGMFKVNPTVDPTDQQSPPRDFGVTLLASKQDDFRLQLIGYVGNPGNYQGTFENVASGETFLARGGTDISSLGLFIKSFEVKVERLDLPDNMPLLEIVATAVLLDKASNEEITLLNRERRVNGPPIATIKVQGEADTRDVREGQSFDAGDAHYEIRSVTVRPPSIQIVKTAPYLLEPESKQLSVGGETPPATAVSSDSSSSTPSPLSP